MKYDYSSRTSVHNISRSLLSPELRDYVCTLRRTRDRRRRMRTLRERLEKLELQQNEDLLKAEMLAYVLRDQGRMTQPSRFAPDAKPEPMPENPPLDGFDLSLGGDA